MAFKLIVNSTILETSFEDFSFTIERGSINEEAYFEGLISTFEISELEVFGSDYNLIKDEYDSNDGCGLLYVIIRNECCVDTDYRGVINLADVKFEPQKCKAIVNITDDGYGAFLKNSKDLSINLGTETHKDGTAMAGIDFEEITLNHPLADRDQYITSQTVHAYKLSDVCDLVIRWTSNGLLSFDSDLLNPVSGSDYYLTTGININNGNQVSPIITFECLTHTLKVLFNANWSITNDVFRVENANYFFVNDVFKVDNCATDLVYGQCEDFLFSKVEIGDEDALNTYDDGGTTLEVTEGEGTVLVQTRYLSAPQAALGGYIPTSLSGELECASGTTLNLKSTCIHWDSNSIEHLAFSDSTDDFRDEFKERLSNNYIIEVTAGTTTAKTGSYDYYPYIVTASSIETVRNCFNPSLTNESILGKWAGYIPSTLMTDETCLTTTATAANIEIGDVPIQLSPSDETRLQAIFNSATNPIYDTTSGLFTPNKAGFFEFCADLWVNLLNTQASDFNYSIELELIKGSFSQSYVTPDITILAANTGDFNFSNSGSNCISKELYIDTSYSLKVNLLAKTVVDPANKLYFTFNTSTATFENTCDNEFTTSEPQKKNCATWNSLENACKFNDILSNTDKNVLVNGLPYFVRRLVYDARTGLSEWEGLG